MTQSSLQTQCPNCKTRFRVTDDQLGIAKGKVRCGNCMDVFNAIAHQVATGATATKSSQAPASEQSSPLTTEDDVLFADNPEEDATEGQYAGSRLTFTEDELSDSFRTIDESDDTNFGPADESAKQNVDESWAEAILEDTGPTPPTSQAEAATDPGTETATETPATSDEHDIAQAPENGPAAEADAPLTSPKPSSPEAPEDSFWTEPDDSFFEPIDNNPDFDLNQPEEQPGAPMTATLPFSDLRREPVAVHNGRGGKLRTLLWSTVVLALMGVLVAQVTWFQFDRLSAIPELRPFYEQGCELAGCSLKPLVNVDAIQSRKLVVRTDPESRMQLVVDAVIINRADFAQPFPAIALTFSNLNGDVVAQSIFTPEEYLAGEGRKLDAMPKDTPVRIAINIRDPGRDAVNYNLDFRPYTP